MSQVLLCSSRHKATRRNAGAASLSLLLAGCAAFALGFAAGALWLRHRSPSSAGPPPAEAKATDQPVLSDGSRAVLSHLRSPVELRFYSILDPTVPDELKTFSQRVDHLLESYQAAAGGKLVVSRYTDPSYTNANAAVRDGIRPFNLGSGDDCFLGIAVRSKDQRQAVAQLSPQWEAALEIDITRAIAEVSNLALRATPPPPTVRTNAPTVTELKRLIPNLETVSLADGTRILREAALKDFGEAAKDSQSQLKEAQEQLAQAKNGGSEADQQAAMRRLQELQAAQSKRLQEIAARSQAQIEALRRYKAQ